MALLDPVFGFKSEFHSKGHGPMYYWWDPGREKNNKKVIITAIIVTILLLVFIITNDNYVPVDSSLNDYNEWVTENGYHKRNTSEIYAYLDRETNTLIDTKEYVRKLSFKILLGLIPGLLIFHFGYEASSGE